MLTLRRSSAWAAWAAPAGLFLLALVVRGLTAAQVTAPPTEGSAYYVGVAANLVNGRGLVTDTLWSYATPPLEVPRAAFELWLPMATFVAAIPMAVLGATFASAQAGFVLVGALIAPLAWLVGREAAVAHGLDGRRTRAVAISSGILAAVLAPFLVAVAGPDSATPFLVLGTLAALLMPRAINAVARGRPAPAVALGVILGLAWLSRQEAVWLALAYVLLLGGSVRSRVTSGRLRRLAIGLAPTVIGGLAVVVPWLVRQATTFGSPFAGQALENAWLTRNEQIFSYLERPDLAGFLAQGPVVIGQHVLDAVSHQSMGVLVLPAFPVGVAGLAAMVALRRSPAMRHPTALAALVLSGGITFAATALLFPVATLWGTFLHASGPLLVGLIVAASLGGDALLARISERRRWERPNIVVAPVALAAVAVVLSGLQVLTVARQSRTSDARVAAVARDLQRLAATADLAFVPERVTLISDHPMWLAAATGRPTLALPDEPIDAVARLADDFGAPLVVLFDRRGRYPDAFRSADAAECLAGEPQAVGLPDAPAWLFHLDPGRCAR